MSTIKLEKPIFTYVRFPHDLTNKATTLDLLRALQNTSIKVTDSWGVEFHPVFRPKLFFGRKVPEEFTKVFKHSISGNTTFAPCILYLDSMAMYEDRERRRDRVMDKIRREVSLTADAEEYLADKVLMPLIDIYINNHLNSPRENPVKASFEVTLVIGSLIRDS